MILTKTVPTKPVNNNLNPWSNGKKIKIYVADWAYDMREVTWNGKTITIEYELFIMLVKDMMKRYDWPKERVLDELFDM